MTKEFESDPRELEALKMEALEAVKAKAKTAAELLADLGVADSARDLESYLLEIDPELEFVVQDPDVAYVLNESLVTTPFIWEGLELPDRIQEATSIIKQNSFVNDPRFSPLADSLVVFKDSLVEYRALNEISKMVAQEIGDDNETELHTTRSIVDHAIYSNAEIPQAWVDAVGKEYVATVVGLKEGVDSGYLDSTLVESMEEAGLDPDDLPKPNAVSAGELETSRQHSGVLKIFGIFEEPSRLINKLLAQIIE